MIQIDNVLISDDVVAKNFVCDLNKCKGECCIAGDIGAPLEADELPILENIYPKVKPYLSPEGIAAIAQQGTWVNLHDDGLATPMMPNNGACAYTIFENGIALCGIEKAFNEKKIDWQKPISCHLYPIRIKQNKYHETLNYNRWSICKDACTNGNKLQVPIYQFVKNGLIRKYGKEFYKQLHATVGYMQQQQTK